MGESFLSIDLGGTYTKYGLIDQEGNVSKTHRIITPKDLSGLLEEVNLMISEYPNSKGIAISAPGAVSHSGVIHGTSAIPYIHGPNIKALIEQSTGKMVSIENDANCAALAESWKGNAQKVQNAIVIVVGTGIGGAFIHQGVVQRGKHLHAGEFGYMLIKHEEQWSSWSELAATSSLRKEVARQKSIPYESIFTGEQIFEMASNGDPECIRAIKQFFYYLAVGIYNIQHMYDPDIILFGGGISAREGFITEIYREYEALTENMHFETIRPKLDTCSFKQHANLVGAVKHFLQSEGN
ncbi:sugar kinase [Oceanobacillus iheyensis HTE831]|uniref:Sugar kinase n=1 Tax=Oceanobacillus iheyensis (strain DSM 14371 / CIP 107618 / JCM 11309 / KCTC 3954 / HTE831) TaxID=221109 RepID=Q8ETC8_OCEIH|nr:ROK family protein [Oceanobacillus iheyensis]BAC12289.1 sugar kinase [Oceanobacillus iheyensis HTE831]